MNKNTGNKIRKCFSHKGDRKCMKLGTRFLLISLASLIITISSIYFLTTYSFRSNLDDQIEQDSLNELSLVARAYESNERVLTTLADSLKNNYLNTAKATREILRLDPDLSIERLQTIVDEINVSEIHVTDEAGILTYSNVPEVIGYDFAADDQSSVFLEGLDDKSFELAQEPMERGADGLFIMYAGLSRLDETGVIQIGIEPEEYQSLVDSFDLQELVENHQFAKTGHVYIADEEGMIQAHPNVEMIGKSVTEYVPVYRQGESGSGQFTVDNQFVLYEESDVGYTFFAQVDKNDYYEQLHTLQQQMLLFGLVALIVVGLFIFFISRHFITRPIASVITRLHRVAEGDLSVSFNEKGRDEISALSKNMNVMVQQLKKLMDEIAKSSMQVAGTSEELAASGHGISESSDEITKSVKSIANHIDHQFDEIKSCTALTDELSIGMKNMTDAIESISENANESSELANRGHETIDETVTQMREMIEQVLQTTRVIDRLNEKTGEIEKIVSIIGQISEQTNLLALNASIEAARAGDAGLGFAVVASEVRQLAEETVESTMQIANIINEVKEESTKAVQMMDETNESVQTNADLIQNAGDSFSSIHTSIDEIATQMHDISKYIQENERQANRINENVHTLSETSKNIVDSVQTITNAVSEHSHTLDDISAATDSLTEMAEALSIETERYNVNDEKLA